MKVAQLCPNSPGQNSGVGSLSLLQGIFTTQGSNSGLWHWRWILYQLNHKGSCITNDHNLSCSNNTDLLSGGFAIQETRQGWLGSQPKVHTADIKVWDGAERSPRTPVLVVDSSSLRWWWEAGSRAIHFPLAGIYFLLVLLITGLHLFPKPSLKNLPDIKSSLILCIFPTSGNAQSL